MAVGGSRFRLVFRWRGSLLPPSHTYLELLPFCGSTMSLSFIPTAASSYGRRKRPRSTQERPAGSANKGPTSLNYFQSSDTQPLLTAKEARKCHLAACPKLRTATSDRQLVVSVLCTGFFLQPGNHYLLLGSQSDLSLYPFPPDLSFGASI